MSRLDDPKYIKSEIRKLKLQKILYVITDIIAIALVIGIIVVVILDGSIT